MKKTLKIFHAIWITPAIFFSLVTFYSFFSRITGVLSFASELFIVFFFNVVVFLLFLLLIPLMAIKSKTSIFRRVLGALLSITIAFVFVVVQAPQKEIMRFYFQIQGHLFLNNLTVSDVHSITIDNMVVTQQKQINQVVAALNNSTWYTPRRGEHTEKGAQMTIILQDGQMLHFQISHFSDEDSVELIEFLSDRAFFYAYIPNPPLVPNNY